MYNVLFIMYCIIYFIMRSCYYALALIMRQLLAQLVS